MERNDYEKETIIIYNEGEPWATVYTHNERLKAKLAKMAADFPEECRCLRGYPPDAVCCRVKKNLVNIRCPRSREFREKMRQHALRSGARPPQNQQGDNSLK